MRPHHLLLLAFVAVTACTSVHPVSAPAPRLTELEQDARVRVRQRDSSWREGRLRRAGPASMLVVTEHGDSLRVDCATAVQSRIEPPHDRAVAGGVYGLLIGAALIFAECGTRSSCGEENPTSLITATAGWFIGKRFKAWDYRDVARADCPSGVTG